MQPVVIAARFSIRHRRRPNRLSPTAIFAAIALACGSLNSAVPMAMAQPETTKSDIGVEAYSDAIAHASAHFDIPERWIRAIIGVESAGDVNAISTAGAIGLMQIMPATWSELQVRHGLGSDPFDPQDNVFAGAAYLREMWDRYGTVAAMLAAYNAGPGRYDRHRATGQALPVETRNYVAALLPELDAMVTAPSERDWREAALFVVPTLSNVAADRASAVAPSSATVVLQSTIQNASVEGGLFASPPENEMFP